MTLKQWHENTALKFQLNQLVHEHPALVNAISVMKEINRPVKVESVGADGKVDSLAHMTAQLIQQGYNQAITDLEFTLLQTKLEHKPIVQKAFEYVKDQVSNLPSLIPTRK